jgi:hypothetical protein
MSRRFSKMHKEILKAGIKIPDAASLYHPGGWPRLGLSSISVELSQRSAGLLTRQVEQFEHSRGNTFFRAQHLGQLDIRLANELANVYVALAERFRGVRIDLMDFCGNTTGIGPLVEGVASMFSDGFPTLHAAAKLMGTNDVREIANMWWNDEFDEPTSRRLNKELAYTAVNGLYRRDALSHASIMLTECFGHPRCHAILDAWALERDVYRARRGENRSYLHTLTSEASTTLIHEFGHAVENALMDLGHAQWRYVVDTMESCLLRDPNGTWTIKDSTLREAGLSRRDVRLRTYQALNDKRERGDGVTRAAARRVMKKAIWPSLGIYASSSRDEFFAEAFSAALVSSNPTLRKQLAPILEALYEVGLSVKRRSALRA